MCLTSIHLPLGFSHQNFVGISLLSHTCDMTDPYTGYTKNKFKLLVVARYSIMRLVTYSPPTLCSCMLYGMEAALSFFFENVH